MHVGSDVPTVRTRAYACFGNSARVKFRAFWVGTTTTTALIPAEAEASYTILYGWCVPRSSVFGIEMLSLSLLRFSLLGNRTRNWLSKRRHACMCGLCYTSFLNCVTSLQRAEKTMTFPKPWEKENNFWDKNVCVWEGLGITIGHVRPCPCTLMKEERGNMERVRNMTGFFLLKYGSHLQVEMCITR